MALVLPTYHTPRTPTLSWNLEMSQLASSVLVTSAPSGKILEELWPLHGKDDLRLTGIYALVVQ